MVTAYLELLQRRYGDQLDETAEEFIGYAVDGAERMQAMIEALLAYSRVGTHDMERRGVRPARRSRRHRAARGRRARRAARRRSPATRRRSPSCCTSSSPTALKFRAPDREPVVTVSAAEEAGGVRIDVADNGIGIPETQHERVFKMFSRLHGRDEYPGTGIGLPLCRRIAERHGGQSARSPPSRAPAASSPSGCRDERPGRRRAGPTSAARARCAC